MAGVGSSSSTSGVTAGSITSAAATRPKPSGKKLGTLVVVIIKARNLPNKQRIGKQDPYCAVTIGHQKNKTPAVKRGGQTPHWDAQLQFEIWEETEDKVNITASDTGGIGSSSSAASSLSSKPEDDMPGLATVGRAKPKTAGAGNSSKRIMKIACYADDPREPELIGEAELDYAPTLKKGEFDEWVEIKYKGKYAGEVFMEMTFYSAAPPPVKRKSKPVIPGAGYGGPGHFEPLPDTFPQSPTELGASSSRLPRPSSMHLSPSPAQPLRMSQSQYGLNSSTTGRPPPIHSSSVDEFGQRRAQSTTPLSFPMPQHMQAASVSSTSSDGLNGASYTPPYAPASLNAPASITPNMHIKPHRASFSGYGVPQPDIDSVLRPLSSLSIGGSANKPLPMPQPSPDPPYRPPPSPVRPFPSNAGQAYSMASQPLPSSFQNTAPSPHPPLMQTNYSQPNHPLTSQEGYNGPMPSHHHRHSMTTYLPDSGDNPWDSSQVSNAASVPPVQQTYSQELGIHNPPIDNSRPAYQEPRGSWQDPRGPSPYSPNTQSVYNEPTSPAYAPSSSSSRPSSYHPPNLQPGGMSPQRAGFSPQVSHMPMSPPPNQPFSPVAQSGVYGSPQHGNLHSGVLSAPPVLPPRHTPDPQSFSAHQTATSEPPVWNNAAHLSSPVLQDSFNPPASQSYGHGTGQDWSHQPQHYDTYQQQPSLQDAYGGQQQDFQQQPISQHPEHGQQWSGQSQAHNDQYSSQTSAVDWGDTGHSHQNYQGQYHPPPQEQYNQYQQQPPPQPAQQMPHVPSQLGHSQQQDQRIASPYRPLPQPTPEPPRTTYTPQHQTYQDQNYGQAAPTPTPPRQPRFGLPVHQPYDPPYVPPSSRMQNHHQHQQQPQSPSHTQPYADQHQQYQSFPPPIPPVPQELRQEQYSSTSYGHHSNYQYQ